jgi:hypothetical protein
MEHKHKHDLGDVNHEHEVNFPQLEAAKEHVKRNWKIYAGVAGGVIFAGITCTIMRDVISQPIGVGIVADAAGAGNVAVAGKKVVMDNVSFISSHRQGSPSWVVRCLETDEVFTSQRKAAQALGVSQSAVSQQLNGIRDTVAGKTFERLCMAVA